MSLEEIGVCPICENTSFTQLHISKDHTLSGEMFHVKQCTTCELIVTSPRPGEQAAAKYYESNNYISHTGRSSGLFDSIYLLIRKYTLRWKLSLVRPHIHEGALLDYGCGTGSFLEKAMEQKLTVFGVEPAAEARKKINLEIPVVESLEKLPDIKFDVITLWHVLEHVYNLRETLQGLRDRMTDRGTIFIAVPNWESYDAQHYRESWAAYDVPRHIWHFSKKSMAHLLQTAGLHINQVIPMQLDAYYVSILSEKNLNSGTLSLWSCVRAMATAIRSNMAGRKETNQSSLIFVVQK